MNRVNVVVSFDIESNEPLDVIMSSVQDKLLHTCFVREFKKLDAELVCNMCGRKMCICNRNRNYNNIKRLIGGK